MFFVAGISISCSSGNDSGNTDGENNENSNESGNGSGNTNRVKYIKERDSRNDYTEVTEFFYDSKGRIIDCFTYEKDLGKKMAHQFLTLMIMWIGIDLGFLLIMRVKSIQCIIMILMKKRKLIVIII